MSTRIAAGFAALFLALPAGAGAQAQEIVLRAASAIDGRGGSIADATTVGRGAAATPTYDLRGLTLLPGLIDTHVHIDTHFGKDGRATSQGETPQQSMLYSVENAYVTLMAGFTTV